METTISFPKPYLAEGTLVIPASEYEQAYREKVRHLRRELVLPGFRPGQVPSDLVMGRYGEDILSELLAEKFLNTLKSLLGKHQLYAMPYYEHTPQVYQVKPPFPDYTYTFRALVIPNEPLLREVPPLTRYVYQEDPSDVDFFKWYMQVVFGHLEELETLPETLPADKHVILRLRWQPYEGAEPLRLRWNSLVEPFPWSYLAGRKVGDTFELPPQALSAYTEYIRLYYPDFSPLNIPSTQVTITSGAYAIPLSPEGLAARLDIQESSSDENPWATLTRNYATRTLKEFNERLRRAQLLHAAGIVLPQDLVQYLYVVYLSSQNRGHARPLNYTAFREELAWELLFRNLAATEPELAVSDEELKESLWQNIQGVEKVMEGADELLAKLRESEEARNNFLEVILEGRAEEFRREVQERRLETLLRERFGEPVEQPIPLKLLLLHTL